MAVMRQTRREGRAIVEGVVRATLRELELCISKSEIGGVRGSKWFALPGARRP